MVRWLLGLSLLLVMALLSGCLQDDPGTEPQPEDQGDPDVDGNTTVNDPGDNGTDEEPAPLAPTTFTASGCNAVVLLAVDDYDAVQDNILPAGFVPADILSLLRLQEQDQVLLGQGAMGVVSVHCEDNSFTGAPFGIAFAGTLVYTPDLSQVDESWVDGYQVLLASTDPQIAALFAAYGWPAVSGLDLDLAVLIDADVHDLSAEPSVPGAAIGQVTGAIAGTQVFDGLVAASTTYHTSEGDKNDIRFWHDTPQGLSYFENHLDVHGKSGTAECSFAGEYAERLSRTACDPGSSVGLIIADFGLETTLIRLDGVHA